MRVIQPLMSDDAEARAFRKRRAKRMRRNDEGSSNWIDWLPKGSLAYFDLADEEYDYFEAQSATNATGDVHVAAMGRKMQKATDWFNELFIPGVALPLLRAVAAENGATTMKSTLEFWLFRGGDPAVAANAHAYTESSSLRNVWHAEATSEMAKRSRRQMIYEVLRAAQRGRDAALHIAVNSTSKEQQPCRLAHDEVLGPLFVQLIATHMHEAAALYPKSRITERRAQLRERNYELNEIIWKFSAAFGQAPQIDHSMRSCGAW
jgi:hypothetical protein